MNDLKNRIAGFVHASRGSKKRALLLALDAGLDFISVVDAMGDEGVKIVFQCICEGLVDRGNITPKGRSWLEKEMD